MDRSTSPNQGHPSKPPGRTVAGWALGVLWCVGAVGCGDGSQDGSDQDADRVESVEEWCAVAEESLPALTFTSAEALDDPGRQHELELEAVDTYLGHYRRLAEGAPDVPDGATDTASQLADTFDEMRDQVADGAALPSVLGNVQAESDLDAQVLDLDDNVEQICS